MIDCEKNILKIQKLLPIILLGLFIISITIIFGACNVDNILKDNSITILVNNKTYDGEKISFETIALSGEKPQILYKIQNTPFTEEYYFTEAPKNVGSYTIMAYLPETKKYKAAFNRADFTITPKEIELKWSSPDNLIYSGQPKIPYVTPLGVLENDICEVEISSNGDNINVGYFTFSAITLSNNNYIIPKNNKSDIYEITKAHPNYNIPTGITAAQNTTLEKVQLPQGFCWEDETVCATQLGIQTYYAQYKPLYSRNFYTEYHIPIEIKIMGQSNASIISDISKLYDGAPVIEPTYTKNGDGKIKIEYKLQSEDDSFYTTTAPSDRGAYYVRLTIEESEYYYSSQTICEFFIANIHILNDISKVYDGTPVSAPLYEKIGDGEVSIYGLATNAGTYYVTITFNGEVIRKQYTITRDISGGTITLNPTDYTYDGSAEPPDPTVTVPYP